MTEYNLNYKSYRDSVNLIHLAFDDYLTSRFLINNDFIMHGTILASTSIEKYLKALLLISQGKYPDKHLDNLSSFISAFHNTEMKDLFDVLDRNFFKVLKQAYTMRYYDKIKTKMTVCFFVNQFLCELDYTIRFLDSIISNIEFNGKKYTSPLNDAIAQKNEILLNNNYLAQSIDKKDFMVKLTHGFAIYYSPKAIGTYNITTKEMVHPPYEGKIMLLEGNENE